MDVIPEKVEKINRKESPIQDEYIEKYLAKFPQYKDSFRVYFCKSDDGARFV